MKYFLNNYLGLAIFLAVVGIFSLVGAMEFFAGVLATDPYKDLDL